MVNLRIYPSSYFQNFKAHWKLFTFITPHNRVGPRPAARDSHPTVFH